MHLLNKYLFIDYEVLEDYTSFTFSNYNGKIHSANTDKTDTSTANLKISTLYNITNNKVLVGYNVLGYDAIIHYSLIMQIAKTPLELRLISDSLITGLDNFKYKIEFRNYIENKGNLKFLMLQLGKLNLPTNQINSLKRIIEKFNPERYNRWIYGNDSEHVIRFLDLMNPSNKVSLKNLDVYYNNNLQQFNFQEYKTIAKIKKDGLLKTWQDYEFNDVQLLSQLFTHYEYRTYGYSYHGLLQLFYDDITKYEQPNIHMLANVVNRHIDTTFFNNSKQDENILNESLKTVDYEITNLSSENLELLEDLSLLQDNLKFQNDDKAKGGINIINSNKIFKGNIIDVDVTSMYPNIMLQKQHLLTTFKAEKFSKMLHERVELKKIDPKNPKVTGYKIALNSTFGRLEYKGQFSKENNNKLIQVVTKTGQNAILKLALSLKKEFNCEILQIATDGILACYPDNIKPCDVLTHSQQNSTLPIDEYNLFNRCYIHSKNNYVVINDSLKVYKGKGKYKIKSKIDRLIKGKNTHFYSNLLLSNMFDYDIKEDNNQYILDNKLGDLVYPKDLPNKITQVKNLVVCDKLQDETYIKQVGRILFKKEFNESLDKKYLKILKIHKNLENKFLSMRGDKGKINYSKNELVTGLDAVIHYEENINNCTGIAIKSNSYIMVIDIDVAIPKENLALFGTFYTYNESSQHGKLIFDISNCKFTTTKAKRDVDIKKYIANRLNIVNLDKIELFYSRANQVTIYRDDEFYSDDYVKKFPIDYLFEFKEIEVNTDFQHLEDKNNTKNIDDINTINNLPIIKDILKKYGEDKLEFSGDYAKCPACKTHGKFSVIKSKEDNNYYVYGCFKTGCELNHENLVKKNQTASVDEFSSSLPNKELSTLKITKAEEDKIRKDMFSKQIIKDNLKEIDLKIFKGCNIFKSDDKKIVKNEYFNIPYKLMKFLQVSSENNLIFKHLLKNNSIIAPTGAGKTYSYALLCLTKAIQRKKPISVICGESHEKCRNLYEEIVKILFNLGIKEDILNQECLDIVTNYKNTNSFNTDNYVILAPMFNLIPKLRIMQENPLDIKEFHKEIIDGTRELFIDESHLIKNNFTEILSVKKVMIPLKNNYENKTNKVHYSPKGMIGNSVLKSIIPKEINVKSINEFYKQNLFNTLTIKPSNYDNCKIYATCENKLPLVNLKENIEFPKLEKLLPKGKNLSQDKNMQLYLLNQNEIDKYIMPQFTQLQDIDKKRIKHIYMSKYTLKDIVTRINLTIEFFIDKFIDDAVKTTATPNLDADKFIDLSHILKPKIKNINVKILDLPNEKCNQIAKDTLELINNINNSANNSQADILMVLPTLKLDTEFSAMNKYKNTNLLLNANVKTSKRITQGTGRIHTATANSSFLQASNFNEYNTIIFSGLLRQPRELFYIHGSPIDTWLKQSIGRICRENKDEITVGLNSVVVSELIEYLDLESTFTTVDIPSYYRDLYFLYKKLLKEKPKNKVARRLKLAMDSIETITRKVKSIKKLQVYLENLLKGVYYGKLELSTEFGSLTDYIDDKKTESIIEYLLPKKLMAIVKSGESILNIVNYDIVKLEELVNNSHNTFIYKNKEKDNE